MSAIFNIHVSEPFYISLFFLEAFWQCLDV